MLESADLARLPSDRSRKWGIPDKWRLRSDPLGFGGGIGRRAR